MVDDGARSTGNRAPPSTIYRLPSTITLAASHSPPYEFSFSSIFRAVSGMNSRRTR